MAESRINRLSREIEILKSAIPKTLRPLQYVTDPFQVAAIDATVNGYLRMIEDRQREIKQLRELERIDNYKGLHEWLTV